MAAYVLKVLDSNTTLKKLERAIQQTEELDFTAVSVSSGTIGGKRGNLLTLRRGAPEGTVTLKSIDGEGDEADQTDRLDDLPDGGEILSYGGVYVGGTLKNVVMVRS